MRKENYKYLGFPLKMDLLLGGFSHEIFNPKGNTQFKWTENLLSQSNGQIAWIRRKISKWVEMVNAESGVAITSHKLKSLWYRNGTHKSWEVTFEFVIPGTLNVFELHQSIERDFSGFFKKFLAEELFRRFPLPFNAGNRVDCEIPFCAGITDMYILKPEREHEPELGNANKILFSDEFRLWLEKILKEKYSAKLFGMKNTGPTRWPCSFIFLKWQNDTTYEVRNALGGEIEEKLKEMGATYRVSGYGPDGRDSYEYAFYRVRCS